MKMLKIMKMMKMLKILKIMKIMKMRKGPVPLVQTKPGKCQAFCGSYARLPGPDGEGPDHSPTSTSGICPHSFCTKVL